MVIPKARLGICAAVAFTVAIASALPAPSVDARTRGKRRARRALRVSSINVDGRSGVALNRVIEMRFTASVAQASVDPSTFRIRAQNGSGTGFTRQIPGDFQLRGSTVRFFPRLPGHLRDPADPGNGFHAVGSDLDDAYANAGLQPSTGYQIELPGHPDIGAIRSPRGRRLNQTVTARFTTASAAPLSAAFSTAGYLDVPPPGLSYSNPSDRRPSVADQYQIRGGTRDVPSDSALQFFFKRVPLSPATVRREGAVTLTRMGREGETQAGQIVPGTAFIEQNFDSVRLVFQPRFPLADRSVYALRMTKEVTDLTDEYALSPNAERLRLRSLYDFLSAARGNLQSQGMDPTGADLPDPSPDLIFDWPQGPEAAAQRAILKEALLQLGDDHPEEIDPRVMLVFTTRDEPVSVATLRFDFEREDGLLDPKATTASWDRDVPGALAAIVTLGGGDGADGDFMPATDTKLSADDFKDGVMNWRRFVIPDGVRVTLTGDRPVHLHAFDLEVHGELVADGADGDSANTGTFASWPQTQTRTRGGLGGPGGGRGGDSAEFAFDGGVERGGAGTSGTTDAGEEALPDEGGRGGLGGTMEAGTDMRNGGGGGGGGSRTAGTAGATSTLAAINGWSNGLGGAGGAGSTNDTLSPLSGGAGGGSGGNGSRVANGWNWNKRAGAGGGAGGAIEMSTSGFFTVGPSGRLRARGGRGGGGTGAVSTFSAGPGGGGGGGSILLRSVRGFSVADVAALTDVRGGAGGTQTGTGVAATGGTGGAGYVRSEDPFGGLPLPGATQGEYSPVGGGAPSVGFTRWADMGVLDARLVNLDVADLSASPVREDAFLIEAQFAVEDSRNLGTPKLTALAEDGVTTLEPSEISPWQPLYVVDRTGRPGGAFGDILGYDPQRDGLEHRFEFAKAVNGKSFKHVRLRVTFQLGDAHTLSDPLPFIDRVQLRYEFNF